MGYLFEIALCYAGRFSYAGTYLCKVEVTFAKGEAKVELSAAIRHASINNYRKTLKSA